MKLPRVECPKCSRPTAVAPMAGSLDEEEDILLGDLEFAWRPRAGLSRR